MKPAVFMRIASAVALLALFGHTLLFLSYVPKHGPEETAVVDAMKSHYFRFGGFRHSYWELYTGYGLFVSISCLMEAVVLWQLASLAKVNPAQVQWIVAAFAIGEAAYAILMGRYFFPTPMVAHVSLAILLAWAWIGLARRPAH